MARDQRPRHIPGSGDCSWPLQRKTPIHGHQTDWNICRCACLVADSRRLEDVWQLAQRSRTTTPGTGTLDAHWTFDESRGRVALDSSGHGLNGECHSKPKRVAGPMGSAEKLDEKADYIDFGHPQALRLTSRMTISAWIKSSSFPRDDAAIMSSYNGGRLRAWRCPISRRCSRSRLTITEKLLCPGRMGDRASRPPLLVGSHPRTVKASLRSGPRSVLSCRPSGGCERIKRFEHSPKTVERGSPMLLPARRMRSPRFPYLRGLRYARRPQIQGGPLPPGRASGAAASEQPPPFRLRVLQMADFAQIFRGTSTATELMFRNRGRFPGSTSRRWLVLSGSSLMVERQPPSCRRGSIPPARSNDTLR